MFFCQHSMIVALSLSSTNFEVVTNFIFRGKVHLKLVELNWLVQLLNLILFFNWLYEICHMKNILLLLYWNSLCANSSFFFSLIYCTHFIQLALHEQAQNKEISLSTLGQDLFVRMKNTKLTNFIYLFIYYTVYLSCTS